MTTALIHNIPMYEGLKVTREEYLDLEEDGFKYDMINGVLVMSPSPFFDHNDVLTEIASLFRNFLRKMHIGKCVVETDVYLPDGGDVLRPDISVILKENYGIIKGHIHGVPDIVVEILSNATIKRDLGVKADRYLSNGVKEYWIVDPDEKTIELWINTTPDSPGSTGSQGTTTNLWNKKEGGILKSSILKGFVLKRDDVFANGIN
ncbi:MAG: Uma2 family endonuclease [Spirochaetia bacterium]|nr:Uma2 family endonuclease [Spirochaetia bacterium]